LRQELASLDGSIQTHFSNANDLALARIPDSQGLGGHSGLRR
jgi:hypothetical protein